MSVTISRDQLGLDALELNDFERYYLGPEFMGAAVVYSRNVVGSPYVHGQTTTSRTKQNPQERITVEVLAGNQEELEDNIGEVIAAFEQSSFDLTIVMDGETTAYRGEAADHQSIWTGPRMIEKQGQVVFTMPRQPIPLQGVM